MTLFNGNNDTGPVFEKGYPRHESYEEYMKRRTREEDAKMAQNAPVEAIDRIVNRIIDKLDLLEERMKTVETDLAYQKRPYATSPEEQRIYDLRQTD